MRLPGLVWRFSRDSQVRDHRFFFRYVPSLRRSRAGRVLGLLPPVPEAERPVGRARGPRGTSAEGEAINAGQAIQTVRQMKKDKERLE